MVSFVNNYHGATERYTVSFCHHLRLKGYYQAFLELEGLLFDRKHRFPSCCPILALMDAPGGNPFAPDGDPGAIDAPKIDLDGNYFDNVMGSDELDRMFNQEGGFDFNESDLDEMINSDNLSLGSGSSLDQLAKMPIVELSDDAVENLLESIAKEEKIPIPEGPISQQSMTPHDEYRIQDVPRDPLLGSLSRPQNGMAGRGTWATPTTVHYKSPFHMKDISQEVDALQHMVNDAVASNELSGPNERRQHGGHLDLEHEKMKLLTRLNEINRRQTSLNMLDNNVSGNQYVQSNLATTGGMSALGDMLRLQQRQNAVAQTATTQSGETPLTSFLRKNQKVSPAVVSAGANLLMRNDPGGTQAASVFSETQWMNQNSPYAQGDGPTSHHFLGTMDWTSARQNMVRNNMAGRSALARSDSGAHIRSGVLPRVGESANATWGDANAPSFVSSGILPKHMSDNSLARSGVRNGLIKNPSKTSLSRENLRGFMRAHSRTSEDSLGGNIIVPIKRRQGTGTKYKVGNSRSVPHLFMENSGSRGDLSQQESTYNDHKPRMNAAW